METKEHEKILEPHKHILTDICIEINNCAECFDEDTKEVDCCPICCLYKELHEISENTFYIEYQNKKMYDKFEEIANKHGYKMIITKVEKREMVKFYKG